MVEIPTINLQSFPDQSHKLKEACEEWGCFRLVNHNIPLSLMNDMKQVVRSLLDRPLDIKKRNTDVIPGSGYMAASPINPLYEALGLYDMASPHSVQTFCSQLDASSHQREIINMYAKGVHEVAMDLAQKVAESLGLFKDDLFKDWPCQFRINKYRFSTESVGSSGVQIHTDSGFLTILQEDETIGGLEVMHKVSGTYIPVDPVHGTFLVNLGDLAKVWSNGRLYNLKHRVVCKESGVRISIASFLLAPKDEPVEAPPELVDEQNPRLYKGFTYEEYRKLRLSTKLHAGDVLHLLRI